jgi:hypothetical protein
MRYIYTSPPARVVAPCGRRNDVGNPVHVGQAAFVARIESDTAATIRSSARPASGSSRGGERF